MERYVGELADGWRRMWDDGDAFFPVASMERVAARLTGADVTTRVAPGLDHAMVFDPSGREVIELIGDFVERALT